MTTDRREVQKRQTVFTKPRRTVLIKVFGGDPILGLPEKKRDEETIDARHELEARERGLEFKAYRPKGDTGFCLFNKELGVRVTNLGAQLRALGLKYTGGHWQKAEGKKRPVNFLNFSVEGDEVAIPTEVFEALSIRFDHCSVWCNLRYETNGEGQYRLDTINLVHSGGKSRKPARDLVVQGNTYRLV